MEKNSTVSLSKGDHLITIRHGNQTIASAKILPGLDDLELRFSPDIRSKNNVKLIINVYADSLSVDKVHTCAYSGNNLPENGQESVLIKNSEQ